ncbi:TPA: hypothetical protein PXP59_003220 [Yersinia enterocolitica]|nr:hypothetical protein [Yersinia enterocolitica]HDL7873321.1 hypothetical protein [Yersinia enterocolitica]HDL7895352.1 hypothetical protein [Yersinia enterocolitica]HDL7898627.1 hypothetical protein [Yersinia enterocolitica]HEN3280318.1 hypothetical protein [Yersinia enterocolitica]
MPDSVSQSPPMITSPFSRTQSAPKSCLCWLAVTDGFPCEFIGNDGDPQSVMLERQL